MAHFTMDQHQKIVRQQEIKLNALVSLLHDSNVSNSSDQSIKNSIELQQRDQLEQRLDGIEETLKKLAHTLEKSTIPSFPSHDVAIEATSLDASATNGPTQTHPLYGMPVNSYPRQPHNTQLMQQRLWPWLDYPSIISNRPTLYQTFR